MNLNDSVKRLHAARDLCLAIIQETKAMVLGRWTEILAPWIAIAYYKDSWHRAMDHVAELTVEAYRSEERRTKDYAIYLEHHMQLRRQMLQIADMITTPAEARNTLLRFIVQEMKSGNISYAVAMELELAIKSLHMYQDSPEYLDFRQRWQESVQKP